MSPRFRADHLLYRLFDADGDLLYVGRTNDLKRRFEQHASHQSWWSEVDRSTAETYTDLLALQAAERAAIVDEQPRYNVVHNGRPCQVEEGPEPIWLTISPRLTAAADAVHRACIGGGNAAEQDWPCSTCTSVAARAIDAADLSEGRALDPNVPRAAKEALRHELCQLWKDPRGRVQFPRETGPGCGAWGCLGRDECESAFAALGQRP